MSNIGAAVGPSQAREAIGAGERVVVAFVCENAGRAGRIPSSGIRPRPTTPTFGWPFPVKEVVVPCAGRLQPEHFLKAFEDGADAVGIICCEEGSCHHLEGSRRCARRLDYVEGLLEQIGLGRGRLKMLHLPGSAKEDMMLGANAKAQLVADPAMNAKVSDVRDGLVAHIAALAPNPMRTGTLPETSPYELESDDDSDE